MDQPDVPTAGAALKKSQAKPSAENQAISEKEMAAIKVAEAGYDADAENAEEIRAIEEYEARFDHLIVNEVTTTADHVFASVELSDAARTFLASLVLHLVVLGDGRVGVGIGPADDPNAIVPRYRSRAVDMVEFGTQP